MCLPTLRLIALALMIMLASPGLDAHAGNAPTPVTAELGTTAGEIDKGLPVIGYPRRDELDCGYAYGYEGAGEDRKFLWRSYHTGDKPKVVPAAEVGPWIMIPHGLVQPPSERTQLVGSLKIAVRNWHRSEPKDAKDYVYLWGREALEAWQADLRDADAFTDKHARGCSS